MGRTTSKPTASPIYQTVQHLGSDRHWCTVSCLWGLQNFLQAGFTKADLIPVKHSLFAANKGKIQVSGAIFLRLSGSSGDGRNCTAAVMTYISPSTSRFYLSREALVQLNVIPPNFLELGAALHQSSIKNRQATCDCHKRTKPPPRPNTLPFECTPANNNKIRDWLIDHYAASTFNQCSHQQLPGMTGPEICFHVDADAVPRAVHTPAPVPLRWLDSVKEQLESDVAMGFIEKVPIGSHHFGAIEWSSPQNPTAHLEGPWICLHSTRFASERPIIFNLPSNKPKKSLRTLGSL